LRPRLAALAKELGVQAHVDLAGATASVEKEYQAAQLFALPSSYEGFPNCLAEALAHGLAAVGFADCPGTNELIRTGVNGILVSGLDRAGGLALALEELMGSAANRRAMGALALESVAQYSLDRITDEWEELLRSVASQERTAISPAARQ
jgi:glycosyltransferase involved in cell wall biosynthesis